MPKTTPNETDELPVQESLELTSSSDEYPTELTIESDGLSFKLEIFEGPLDLLLALIAKNKVNIYDIPIALILDQYLEYIHQMDLFNLEVASEFIVMAAQLMVIKSRLLLPRDEEAEEDPRQELVDLLLEYQRAKKASEVLHDLEATYGGRFEKPPMPLPGDPDHSYKLTHDISLLEMAYKRVYERHIELMEAMRNSEKLDTLLKTTRHVSVGERIRHVMQHLSAQAKSKCAFSELFENAESRSEIVATFLAVLELIKGKRLMVEYSGETFDDCDITLLPESEEATPLIDLMMADDANAVTETNE